MIGRIGTLLGEAKLNIANFALGRKKKQDAGEGSALAVVQLDLAPGDATRLAATIAQLRSTEAITSVRVVELESA